MFSDNLIPPKPHDLELDKVRCHLERSLTISHKAEQLQSMLNGHRAEWFSHSQQVILILARFRVVESGLLLCRRAIERELLLCHRPNRRVVQSERAMRAAGNRSSPYQSCRVRRFRPSAARRFDAFAFPVPISIFAVGFRAHSLDCSEA
jgi:hypothetical protein